MCFGNTVQTEAKQSTTALPQYLTDAAQTNVSNAQSLTSKPATPYTGDLSAPQTADENTGNGMLRAVAGTSDPYSGAASSAYDSLISTPGSTITPASMIGGNKTVGNSTLQDYMSPYIDATLAPQMQAIDRSQAANDKSINAQATMSGAFGDARHGVMSSNNARDSGILRANTVGTAYNNAFNSAAAMRGQDITNDLTGQQSTAQNKELALQRAATGATDLTSLDKYDTGRSVDLAQALSAAGATSRGVQQTGDTAAYNEFLRGQNWDPQMLALMTQVLSGTPHDTTTNSTTQAPDNSGFGLLSSILGAAGSVFKGAGAGIGGG